MEQQIFNDRYSIITKIGSGGMAEVYKAKDMVLDRAVAVKVLHRHFAEDVDFVTRFRREAQAAASLNHPNIVNIYDWGSQNGTYFIVMELLEGQSLKEHLTDRVIIQPTEAMEIAKKVLSALNFAHKHNIVHRDIKPHNIIMTDEGEVKVTDFGIARSGASTMTQTGTVLGTAHYLSPEQARGQDVGAASDIYSMGVVLYEMLTGQVPFDGENTVAIALKHVHDIAVRPRDLNPRIPETLQTIVAKAMAKNPESRYQSASEMRNDIMRALQGMPIAAVAPEDQETLVMASPTKKQVARQPGRTDRVERTPAMREPEFPTRRKRWPLVVTMLMIAALATVGWFAFSAGLIGPKPIASVPNVQNLPYEEASRILVRKNFLVEKAGEQFSNMHESGTVLKQDPEPGEKAEEGRTVSLIVSKGQDLRRIPDLAGERESKAAVTLAREGFEVGDSKYENSDTIAEGIVISTVPAANDEVPVKTKVSLVVSKGQGFIQIPDVINKTQADAEAELKELGFQATVSEEFSNDLDKGKVTRTTPAGGTERQKGSTITVFISKGPEMITVPDVKNKYADEAKSILADAGFTIADEVIIENVSPDLDSKVISQDPAANAEVRKSDAKIIISIGRAPQQ